MTQRTFDDLYAHVPADQRAALADFRAQHPPRRVTVNGTGWEYIDSGQGDQTVLLLVGGLRVADAAHRNIPMLDDTFRVITPTYPALNTMADLCDGLAGVLDAAGVARAHVLAGSFGGMLAQVFVRRHGARVDRLVLSTTAVLDDDSAARYRAALDFITPLPPEQVAEMAKAMMFDTMAPPPHEHDFYRAFLDELYSVRVDKAAVLSTYHCLLDFAENISLRAADLDGWPGEILVLESDDDATFDEKTRAAVRALYPRARTHTFHNAGHSPSSTQRDLYYQVVKTFLSDGQK